MSNKGFTLIEVLLAVAILGIIFSMVYWTFSQTYDVIDRVQTEADRFRSVRLTINKISEDLSSTYWREDYKDSLFVGEDLGEERSPKDSIRFMAASNYGASAGSNDSDLNIISYYLERAEDKDIYKLMRSEQTNILSISNDQKEAYELGDSLNGINFRYFNGKDWVDSWNSDELKSIPMAVEIKMLIKDNAGRETPFVVIKEIPMGKAIKRP